MAQEVQFVSIWSMMVNEFEVTLIDFVMIGTCALLPNTSK